jgi:hypothetical protein
LVTLNVLVFIALAVNVASRLIQPRGWWNPEAGCPQPRRVGYKPLSYGDSVFETASRSWERVLGNNSGGYTAAHIIMAPYYGHFILAGVEHYLLDLNRSATYGVVNVLVVYQPLGVLVPERGWRYAQKWATKQCVRIVIDRVGTLVTELRLDPCECVYSVVLNGDNEIRWAAEQHFQDRDFWRLVQEVAQSDR